ncbi:MAG TPA: PAS domain-containing protein, partial [Terriglobales bacterium]
LRFSVECQPIAEPIYVDRDMWEKVVSNLLSNAFKFTFEGEVAVTLKPVDHAAELQVRDTGVGIPEEHRERVFERFHRIEGTRARTYEGTGIGLALVQELVKLHGGNVRVESAVGQGSTFTVTVPGGFAHLPAERIQATRSLASAAVAAGAYAEEALLWLPNDLGRETSADRAPKAVSPAETCPKRELIIIADDNADMRQFLKRLLDERYEVHPVTDGREALDLTRRLRPSLVLADVMMPRLDGFGLLRAIREDSALASTPVILLSAQAGEESRVKGLQEGADDYLVKPFAARELLARVDVNLKMSNLRRETAEREERLRGEAADVRLIVDMIPGLVCTANPAGVAELVNRQTREYFGKTIEELQAWATADIVHPDDLANTIAEWTHSVETGDVFDIDHRLRRPDGSYRWFHTRGVCLRDAKGRIVRWYILLTDVDERKRAEESLKLQVQVLQNIPVNAWTVLPDGMQDFTNQQWLEYTGLTMDRFLSSPQAWMSALHPDDHERAAAAFWGGIRSGSAFTSETRFRRVSDGEYRWHLNRGIPLRDSAGNLIKFVGTSTDIEDVKRAEEALRASERDVRLIVDTIPGMVCTLKADWEVEFVNKPLREYFGKTLEELKDWEFIGVVHPDDIERVVTKTRHSTATGEPYEVEHRCLRHDGVFRWFQVRAMPLRDAAGHVVRWYLLLTDIEDRKRAEEALQLQVEVLQYMPAAAWTLLPDGATDFANQQWLEYTGQTLEYKRSSPGAWMTALHPDDLERAAAAYWEGIRSGKATTVETRFRRSSDGEYRWHLNRAIPLRDSSGKLIKFVGTSTDIEDLKQAERELRQLIDFLPQCVAVLDKDGALLNANKTMLDYMGLTLEEMKGGGTRERIKRDIHPDDLERVQKERSAGLSRGVPFESEKRLLAKDGRYRWFLFRYNPLLNEAGDIVRWFVAATDIEDRKQAEDRMRNETVALREQIDRESMFEDIVGSSEALRKVLRQVAGVARTDSTVLICGETGTGKELIARAIHKRSLRSDQAFVSVNCASIPPSLIASELFGHEKGAFTGALQQRKGRFELAQGGTIFLDEIGELPAETQIALLRVLQERQFERVGGSKAISVNVRVITATNRDLSAAIAAGTFRTDLFYRLNVFPIQVPPLRLRRDDIPMLVEYFVKRFAEKMGKQISQIDKNTIELCQKYHWPGNIRELQN